VRPAVSTASIPLSRIARPRRVECLGVLIEFRGAHDNDGAGREQPEPHPYSRSDAQHGTRITKSQAGPLRSIVNINADGAGYNLDNPVAGYRVGTPHSRSVAVAEQIDALQGKRQIRALLEDGEFPAGVVMPEPIETFDALECERSKLRNGQIFRRIEASRYGYPPIQLPTYRLPAWAMLQANGPT
jgi:hypothetical protein